MKTIIKLLFVLPLSLWLFTCGGSDDSNDSQPPSTEVFVNYSVSGNSKNGTFNITDDENSAGQNVYGLIAPNADGNAVIVEYLDGNQLMSVSFAAPAVVGTYEITDNSPYGYNIGFGFEDISLQASAVSINITAIEFNGVVLEHIKGSFTGTAMYTHTINGDEVEEPHLVDGTFEYNAPSF
ncbi:hypothetical protein M0G43_09290 [Subsaxibacter sp. CAU 1640]|uniref:hypothetical protein n=1 Tax=Subsaxibacter sp. CAU 1640 TaxID=2933271 RepID=UPI002003B296|nr:hypothetical protein [Subsaxibacter sp. CAU 1640]MCK7590767.1 hypothetical protein [Subsaxibacter sp. CAU 1640]